MQCNEFDSRLHNVMDLRLPPERDRELQIHAVVCAGCRQRLAAAIRLLDGLELLDPPALSADFADRVVSQVAAPSMRTSNLPRMLVTIAVAATLLLVVFPGAWYLLHTPLPAVAERSAPGARPREAAPYAPDSETASTQRKSDDRWWMLPRESIMGLYPEEIRARHRQQVNEIAKDLRPIASPFNAAVAAFRKTLPIRRSHDKGQPRASHRRGDPTRHIS